MEEKALSSAETGRVIQAEGLAKEDLEAGRPWAWVAEIVSDGRGQRRGRVGQMPISCEPPAILRILDFI